MEHILHIERNYELDTLKIYWKERQGSSREVWYHYDGEHLVVTEFDKTNAYRPNAIKPFIQMPLAIGDAFLILLSNKVLELGIDSKKQDMQAGKLEILESELSFNKEQLVKFIDHFTKSV